MTDSTNLEFSLVSQSQSQKEVTVNEALVTIDALMNRGAESLGDTTPPGGPTAGDVYIIGSSATGDWSGHDGEVTYYYNSTWYFIAPNEGLTLWVNDIDAFYAYDGSAWVEAGGASDIADITGFDVSSPSTYEVLQHDGTDFVNQSHIDNLSRVGINTTSDSTNKLAVASDAVLLTADSNDMQLKINKTSSSDTASILLQDNTSGRTEIGLTGDDDTTIKVSSDGSTWNTAFALDKSTGNIKNAGKIGIGTDPSYLVDALSSTNQGLLKLSTSYSTLAYLDYYNTNSTVNAGLLQRYITRNKADTGTTSFDVVKYNQGGVFMNNNEPDAAASTSFGVSGTQQIKLTDGVCRPSVNNYVSLGSSSHKWTEVFAVTGTINTSDERLKTDITPVNHGLDLINKLNPVSYKWKEGRKNIRPLPDQYLTTANPDDWQEELDPTPGKRTHYGLIAQQVKQAMSTCGIDDFAGWILTDPENPESEQGLRYEQFIPFLIKAVQELEERVQELENNQV